MCRSASSIVTTSAATESLQSCRETIRQMLVNGGDGGVGGCSGPLLGQFEVTAPSLQNFKLN